MLLSISDSVNVIVTDPNLSTTPPQALLTHGQSCFLSPHSKKVAGSISGPEALLFLPVCVNSQLALGLSANCCLLFVLLSMWPCDKLVTYPGRNPASA